MISNYRVGGLTSHTGGPVDHLRKAWKGCKADWEAGDCLGIAGEACQMDRWTLSEEIAQSILFQISVKATTGGL